MAFEHVSSVLVADIGSVHTRLLLIDLVEGQYGWSPRRERAPPLPLRSDARRSAWKTPRNA